MSIRCPHCGGTFSGYRKERDSLALQLGRCTACGKDKTDAEIAAGHWKCADYRRIQRNKARRTRYRGIAFAPGISSRRRPSSST